MNEEKSERGKGSGFRAMCMMLQIATEAFHLKRLEAKISFENKSSIHIFQHKFGFHEISRSEVFKEITFERTVDNSLFDTLKAINCQKYNLGDSE